MAVSSVASGTQTATIGTEHILNSPAGPATYVLVVDVTNMALIDVLELRAYSKAKSGGTLLQYLLGSYAQPQANLMVQSVPVPSVDGAKFTLKQVAGTGRAYDWNIYAL
jgi:hypothetical protein